MSRVFDFFVDAGSISIIEIAVAVLLSTVTATLIYLVFIRCAVTFSNRRHFGRIFLLVTVCTALIITVIKSSIALSLGLVGALSIVRFRAAIKEPEELAYLFLCIAAGLGYGARETVATFFSVLLILAILIARYKYFSGRVDDAYNFSVSTEILSGGEVAESIKPFTNNLKLRRLDSNEGNGHFMFLAVFTSLAALEEAISDIRQKDPAADISFISSDIQA
jgi:hypothetical protein